MTITLLVLALVAIALAGFGHHLLRGRQRPAGPVVYCRCPSCRQKLRCRPVQLERRMLCPRCVRTFTPHALDVWTPEAQARSAPAAPPSRSARKPHR